MNTGAKFVHTASLRLMSVCNILWQRKLAIHECLWQRSEDFALPLQIERRQGSSTAEPLFWTGDTT